METHAKPGGRESRKRDVSAGLGLGRRVEAPIVNAQICAEHLKCRVKCAGARGGEAAGLASGGEAFPRRRMDEAACGGNAFPHRRLVRGSRGTFSRAVEPFPSGDGARAPALRASKQRAFGGAESECEAGDSVGLAPEREEPLLCRSHRPYVLACLGKKGRLASASTSARRLCADQSSHSHAA